MDTFSIKEALAFGWATTKRNFWFLVGLMILLWAVSYVSQMLGGSGEGLGSLLISLISWLLVAWVKLGAVRISLALVDGKPVSFGMLKVDGKSYITYIAASVLVGVMVAVGLVALIIPGIILALAFGMYSYRIVDANAGIVDSIKQSAAITRGHRWQLFGLALSMVLLNIIGALLFVIGLLVTIPVTMLAHAYVYRKLSGQLIPAVAAPTAPVLIEDLQKTA
ncbi:MAG: DUF975 family protein [Candidatus Andersenbacteria bacterium]|nr:DUF975 family protein [Candidatus Andersenbacteria bacterium]